MRFSATFLPALALIVSGCAQLEFTDGAPPSNSLPFYDTVATRTDKVAPDCTLSIDYGSVPGKRRYVRLRSGWGAAKLSVNFSTMGTISSVNQETDSKIPDTINAVAGVAKTAGDLSFLAEGGKEPVQKCAPSIVQYVADGNGGWTRSAAPLPPTAAVAGASEAAIHAAYQRGLINGHLNGVIEQMNKQGGQPSNAELKRAIEAARPQ